MTTPSTNLQATFNKAYIGRGFYGRIWDLDRHVEVASCPHRHSTGEVARKCAEKMLKARSNA